jgi:hypothetical protein
MSHLELAKSRAAELVREPPEFGAERFAGAIRNYAELAPEIRQSVAAMSGQTLATPMFLRDYQGVILHLVSLECAAGASAARCRAWFACLADLAWTRIHSTDALADPVDIAAYSALAGIFNMDDEWPDKLAMQQTSARILYMLMTGKSLDLPLGDDLFDFKEWIQLRDVIERKDAQAARIAFISLAEWWFAEYRDAEVQLYNPSSVPSFELLPNAALAFANLREGLSITFDKPEHRQFYVAALLY